MKKFLPLFFSLLVGNSLIAQVNLVDCFSDGYNETDATIIVPEGQGIDITDCTSWQFTGSWDTDGVDWSDATDLSSADECGACAGDPSNPLDGDCDNCWDMLSIDVMTDVGGSIGITELIGLDGSSATAGNWDTGIICNTDNSTNLDLNITLQNWDAAETWNLTCITVVCWDLTPTPSILAQCELGDLTIEETSGLGTVDWYLPGNAPPAASDGTGTPFTINPANVGMHNGQWTVMVTDGDGCTGTEVFDVTLNNAPFVNPTQNGPICAGQDLLLDEIGGEGVSWTWDGPNGNIETDDPTSDATIIGVTAADEGLYSVTVTDANGCTNTGELTFELTVSAVANNDCATAEDIDAMPCTISSIAGSTIGACPELTDVNCMQSVDPTVWYTFTTPTGTTGLDFSNVNDVSLQVITDCPATTSIGPCITGDTNLPITDGTYWISATTPGGEDDFSFDINFLVPPANDLCADATVGSGTGTTCCATTDNYGCSNNNTVWHMYTIMDPSATITIDVTNVSIGGVMGVDIFIGDCTTVTNVIAACLAGSNSYEITCPGTGDVYVQISNLNNAGCGEYSVEFTETPPACSLGSVCGSDYQMFPVTDGAASCQEACNDGICSAAPCAGIGMVWFEMTTDGLSSGIIIDVNNPDFTPEITVLEFDCTGAALISCFPGTTSVFASAANTTYYIGISSNDGTTGDFELCVTSIQSFSDCGSGDIQVTRPENPSLPVEGPYCVGEKINVCFEVNWIVDDAGTGNNCQWLQGVVPALGGGWDLAACPLPTGVDQGGTWFPDFAVNYTASTSIYGLSTNCAGDPILEVGSGVGQGTGLPGGWFWTSPGGGQAACTNDGNPNTMYGLAGGCGTTQSVSFCFDLQPKTPVDAADCADPCFNELDISFFTFADGQTGCWAQNSCAADIPSEFLGGALDCSGIVEVDGPETAEICSGQMLDLDYTASDGLSDIMIEFTDNPNVTGEIGPITWPAGTASIDDVLINTGNTPEIVIYTLQAVNPNPGSGCQGPPLILEVTVNPGLMIEFDEPYNVCWDEQINITPTIIGGTGPYTYEWDNGDTGASIMAPPTIGDPPGTYDFMLTVTDATGCTGSEMGEYIIHPQEMITHVQTIFTACQDGMNDGADICLVIMPDQNGPFTYDWTFPGGLSANPNGPCLVIDDENSTEGIYDISVIVTDAFGCEYEHDGMMFNIDISPEIELVSVTCSAGGSEYLIEVCDNNGGLPDWSLFDAAYVTLIDGPYNGNCATFMVSPTALGITLPETFVSQAIYPITGCLNTLEITIDPPGIIEFDEPYDVCWDEQVPITPTIVGGVGGPYTYNWDNGDTGPSTLAPQTIGEPAGTYTYVLTVTDAGGCTSSESVDYTIHPEEMVDHVQTIFAACADGIDDGADICLVIMPDQNGPFTYDWTYPPGLSGTNSGACLDIDDEDSDAGQYDISVIVTDAFGCEYMHDGMTFEIQPVPDIDLTSITCSGDLEYSFEVCDLNGGIPDWELFDDSYTTQLDGPLSGNCVTFTVVPFTLGDLMPITFGVVATDPGTGCFSTFDVTIDPPVVPEFDFVPEACEGEEVTVTLVNWNDFQSHTWCDGTFADVYTVTLDADDHFCTVELVDLAGCTYFEEIEIMVNPAVEAEISGSLTFCTGGETILTTIDDPSWNYDWSNGDTGSSIIVDQPGTYTVTVSSATCSATDEVDVSIDFTLEPIVNGEDLCAGGLATLTTGPNFVDYEWFDPNGLSILPVPGFPWVIDVDEPGEYTVEVSDGTCFGTGIIYVEEVFAAFAEVEQPTINPCNDSAGGTTTIDLTDLVSDETGPVTYMDENGVQINTPSSVDFDGYTAGTYTLMVIIEADDPCDDFEAAIVITVDDCSCPGVLFNNIGDFCNDAEVTRDLTSFLLPTSEVGGTFSVNNDMGVLAANQPVGNMLTINSTWTEGTYTLIYTLASVPAGCPEFHTETFTIFGLPDATLTQNGEAVCNTSASGGTTMVDLDLYVSYSGVGQWQDASGIAVPNPNALDFAMMPIGTSVTYFYVTTDAMDPPCSNLSLPFIVTVVDCDCPIIGLSPIPDELCNTDLGLDLNPFLTAGTEAGYWISETVNWTLPGNGLFDPVGLTAGTYVFSYNLNIPVANCDSIVLDSIIVFEAPILAQLQDTSLCGSGLNLVFPTSIDLTGMEPAGYTGTWTAPTNYNNGIIPDVTDVQFVDTLPGAFEFIFTTNSAMGPCLNESVNLTINIQNCDCPIIQIEPLTEVCETVNASINLSNLELPLNPEGTWSYGNGPSSNVTLNNNIFDATDQPAGEYIFIFTLDSPAMGCAELDSTSIIIYEPNLIPSDFPSELEACSIVSALGETTVNLEELVVGIDGSWETPVDYPTVISDFSAVDFEGLNPGSSYDFNFVTNISGACPSESASVTITVNDCDCPNIQLTPLTEVCTSDINTSIDLSDLELPSNPDGTWSYGNGPLANVDITNNVFEASGQPAGEYIFIYTLDDPVVDCPALDSVSVVLSEANLIPLDFPSDLEACSVISGQAPSVLNLDELIVGVQGSWETPANYPTPITDYSSVDFEGLDVGDTYEFTFTTDDSGTCPGESSTVTITVNDCNCPNVFIDEAPDLCTDGDSFMIDGVITAGMVDGSLSLQDENGAEVNLTNGLITAGDLAEGMYVIIFTPDDPIPADCPQGDTTTINIVAPPSSGIFSIPMLLCENEDEVVDLFSLLEGESSGGMWIETSAIVSVGNAFDEQAGTFNGFGQGAGSYTFEYTFDVSNTPCDPVATTVEVEIEAPPIADAGPGGILDCDNNFVVVGGTGSSIGSDFEYIWINPSGDTLYQGSTLEYEAMMEGEWSLTVVNINSGCSATASTLIDVDGDLPSFEYLFNDAPCNEENGDNTGNIMITNTTGAPPFQFSLDGGSFENDMEWFQLNPGTYTVTMLDANNCQSPPESIIIAEPGPITYDIGDDQLSIEIGETVILQSSGLDGLNIASLTWTADGEVICTSLPDGECAEFEIEPLLVPTTYCLEIITEEGCEASVCRVLQALDVRDVFIPNVISIGNDEAEANTNFYVHTDNFAESIPEMSIYDRWGELLFNYENGEPNNPAHGWDGTFNGELVLPGVYVYLIKLEFIGGDSEIYAGSITVLR